MPLTKYIARSGYASRRQAEVLIRSGSVTVNGAPAVLGMRVRGSDAVRVGSDIIAAPRAAVYLMLNKPEGYVCTTRRHNRERNVLALLTAGRAASHDDAAALASVKKSTLHIVGRLDKDSRGLVLLTNDGDFTLQATHPRYQHEKEYEVRVTGLDPRDEPAVAAIEYEFKHGVMIGAEEAVAHAKKCEHVGAGVFRVILTEGKKRQIRRMFEALGYAVQELVRVRIGAIELGDLPEGQWRMVPPRVARQLKNGA